VQRDPRDGVVIRSIWVALNLLVSTATLSLAVVLCALFRIRGDVYDRLARLWSRWTLAASGARVRVEGAQHIRSDAPQIIISNHQSWYDVWALAAYIPGRYRFIAKKELARIPLFGQAWQAAGHISVDRSDRQAAIRSLEQAARRVREDNSSVVIFPEGTRSPTGELLPFKKGAFMLALQMGVDIVPTAVIGGRAILPKGGWRVRSGDLIVRFGEPVPIASYSESNRDELIARVRAEIQRLLDAPVAAADDGASRSPGTDDATGGAGARRRDDGDTRPRVVERRSTAGT
jgi:1-acyl-sn-glycerol-3-phosphate acyltransferase